MIGQTLGHYRIVEKLGEGGMGVVHRAQDTRLGRDVAIKLLPEAFARDPDRLARFECEARVLASLNHRNIAAIHGVEEQDGRRYLVLEYVPGVTLAERLKRGRMPIEETVEVCTQIAEALEAAHERGIIHRDLKPANVKVTAAGEVKVLDFGLAKVPELEAAASAESPTISAVATRGGIILGTAAYMSPEQARGRPLDKRADIWALGSVLYQCLSGKQAFAGESTTDTIAAIVKSEPDWKVLPPDTPPAVERLLRRCLQKDPRERLRDAGDAVLELKQPSAREPAPAAAARSRALPWIAAALFAIFALASGS